MLPIKIGEYFSFFKNIKGNINPVVIRSKLDSFEQSNFGIAMVFQGFNTNSKVQYIVCDYQFNYIDSTFPLKINLAKQFDEKINL